MTPEQNDICTALGKVTYLPASFDKRFGNNLYGLAQSQPEKELSEKQNEWMYRLLYKYRKQLPKTYERYKANPLCSRLETPKPKPSTPLNI
jgi:hypothetical protein